MNIGIKNTLSKKVVLLALLTNSPSFAIDYDNIESAPVLIEKFMLPTTEGGLMVVSNPNLPDDPGKGGEKTLLGVDSDADGIRDDFEIHVARKYQAQDETSRRTRRAGYQYSYAMSQVLANSKNPGILDSLLDKVRDAIACVHSARSEKGDGTSAVQDFLTAYLNTSDRYLTYVKASQKPRNAVIVSTKDLHKRCD